MKEFRATLALCLVFAFTTAMLAGCTGRQALHSAATLAATAADAAGARPPAPAEVTAVDEKLLSLSARAVEAAAKACSAMVRTGVITRGSPVALQLSHWLGVARDAILAAEQARKALSATSYLEALARADEAVAAILALISPFGD